MNILFVAAEISPLTKVGGLADVVRSLPPELLRRGNDVRVMVPKYGFVDYGAYKQTPVISGKTVMVLQRYWKVGIEQVTVDGVPVYLLASAMFDETDCVYGHAEVEKFCVFCHSVVAILPYLGWIPEIVHCHDWHTALIPMLLRLEKSFSRTVLTIHNIRYHGNFDDDLLSRSGLSQYWHAVLPGNRGLPYSLLPQGILWADQVNTVSESYAREILTPEYGCGMQGFLDFRRESVSGIRNGLGYEEYDPEKDGLIEAVYGKSDMSGKSENRRELQALSGWKYDERTPIAGMVSRMDEQKGIDILLSAIPEVLSKTAMRFIFLGRGKDFYEEALKQLEARYPACVRTVISFDTKMAHMVYAGADLFLMPSLWEPCGLGQMIAMRYGTVPVVRNTGGLSDTVKNLTMDMQEGTGFVFNEYSPKALEFSLRKAAEAFNSVNRWQDITLRVMAQDFSWQGPAAEYEALYRRAMEFRWNVAPG